MNSNTMVAIVVVATFLFFALFAVLNHREAMAKIKYGRREDDSDPCSE